MRRARHSETSTRSSTTPPAPRSEASSSSIPDEWDDVLAVNLRGAFLGLQVVGGSMRERGRGRVVNVSSDAAFSGPGAMGAHYAASKAGLLALTRRAAAELAGSGVTVNAVAPGALDGETLRELVPGPRDGRDVDSRRSASAARRRSPRSSPGSSDDAGYVTGATFRIDGGATL